MAKYIINVPDEIIEFMNGKFDVLIEPEVKIGECRHYKVRLDDTEVTPYTETDREDIENEVWEFAWEVLQLDLPVFREIFGYDTDKMDYREYKSKYEVWLKQKDEIHIGDEVIPLDTQYDTMVVTKLWTSVCHDEWVDAIASDGKFYSFLKTSIKKTGRHFNEVEELLKKMMEELDD